MRMLSALDLARRTESGEMTPEAVLDLCAEAIAARESEIGAFIALDLEAARANAKDAAARRPPARNDGDDRARLCACRQDQESTQPRPYARRFVVRLGGGGRRRHAAG